MDDLKSEPAELTPGNAQPEAENAVKAAWVTPLVREYDPTAVTKAFFSGPAAVDNAIYS